MSETPKQDSTGLEVSATGFAAKGNAYEDLRPVIKETVELAKSFLSVINNVVGLPADYLNHHLRTFRERFQEKISEIPEEKRCSPPLRLGCGVLKEVAAAAEEPEIQRMFAELLAASCNTDTKDDAHPGFAAVINQMTALDARTLGEISHGAPATDKTGASVDNLIRLGLIEWKQREFTTMDSITLRPRSVGSSFSRGADLQRAFSNVEGQFHTFARNVSEVLGQLGKGRGLRLTKFGKRFLETCVPKEQTVQESAPPPQ